MPVPTHYTEATLADYMVAALSNVAVALGWDGATREIAEAVAEVELACGVADIADAAGVGPQGANADIAKIRALARREAWRAARGAMADRYNVALLGPQRFDRDQIYQHCEREYARAATDAAVYGDPTGTVEVAEFTLAPNPYGPLNLPAGEIG